MINGNVMMEKIGTSFKMIYRSTLFVLLFGMTVAGHTNVQAAQGNQSVMLTKNVETIGYQAQVLERTITVDLENVSLKEALEIVARKANLKLVYSKQLVPVNKTITLQKNDVEIEQILWSLLEGTGLRFAVSSNGHLVLMTREDYEVQNNVVIQTGTITGQVTDAETGETLPGANIRLEGTTKGVSADENGKYTLDNIESGKQTFIASFIGYEPQEKTVSVKENEPITVNFQLKSTVSEMDEMVVVGFGRTKRKDLTGSVSSIQVNELQKQNPTNLDVGLVGRAAGVHVVKSSGAPGAPATIRIRGATSVIGSNEPLYVIDGIPMERDRGLGNEAYRQGFSSLASPLASINPADIESIDILKDASASAIYGSRASNGVVIITTKKGKAGEPSVNFRYNTSFSQFTNKYDMLSADQYHEVVREAYSKAGDDLPSDDLFMPYGPDANSNWQNAITRTASTNDYYLNINGGSLNGNTLYSFSGSTSKENGVIDKTNFERYNLRTKVETKPWDKLRFGTSINYGYTKNEDSNNAFYYTAVTYRPDIPTFTANDNYGASPDSVRANPYAKVRQPSYVENQSVIASLFAELDILKNLTFRSTISYNLDKGENRDYTPSTDPFEIRNGRQGSLNQSTNTFTSRNFNNTLKYIQYFNKHSINLTAGAAFSQRESESTTLQAINFPDDDILNDVGSAESIQSYGSGGTISGLESYFLRANYNYNEKYYATFTARTDKSTKFGPNNRWGFFPSGALAWRISDERFLKDADFIKELKLRTSIGKTGSADFSDFQYSTLFGTGSFYDNHNGVTVNSIPNPDIAWESTNQFDVAVEYNLFNDKLRGSVNYFQKKTINQILNRDIIRSTGGNNQFYNIGDFSSKGIEITLGTDLHFNEDLSFTSSINFTKSSSKVEKLNGGSYPGLVEGEPLGYFEGYKVSGIFQNQDEIDALNQESPEGTYQSSSTAPGDFKFVDVNDDGFISSDDRTIIGKAEPDFYGGWNNIVYWKNFSLTAFFNFSYGNSLFNANKSDLLVFGSFRGYGNNFSQDILDAWSTDNKESSIPRLINGDPNFNSRDSDYFVEDASFFRLKNLQISYTFRDIFSGNLSIRDITVTASATNLFTITPYTGLDPEVNFNGAGNLNQGFDNARYPQTKSYRLGININF